jgi:hypothetical protein
MSTTVISYAVYGDYFDERTKRTKRLRYGEFNTLQEALQARREYMEEIAVKLSADEVVFVRADGTEEMVSVRGSEKEKVLKDLEEIDDEEDKDDCEDDNASITNKTIASASHEVI